MFCCFDKNLNVLNYVFLVFVYMFYFKMAIVFMNKVYGHLLPL